MPEASIGFFPDIGATWLLSRAPGEIGTFLGLTGEGIGGADAIYAGLADFFVASAKLPALVEALSALPATATLAESRPGAWLRGDGGTAIGPASRRDRRRLRT